MDYDKMFIEAKVSVQRLLNDLHNGDFDSVVDNDVVPSDWFEDAQSQNWIPDALSGTGGASRVVFWYDDMCDFVYKIQIANFYINGEKVDYNANEAEVYVEARKAGLESYFAWTAPVAEYVSEGGRHLTINAMAFCECSEEEISDQCKRTLANNILSDRGQTIDDLSEGELWDLYDDISDIDSTDQMMEFAAAEWGSSTDVEEFLMEIGCNDLHSGNWGRLNGDLVMVDYAGWNIKIA